MTRLTPNKNRMKNTTNIVLGFLLFISLVGCKEKSFWGEGVGDPNYFGFLTSEIVVDVESETKSFRIEGEWTHKVSDLPQIEIDRDTTTAKHKFHFVNTPESNYDIGKFTPLLEGNKVYKDVVIMPENIKEKVVILYRHARWNGEPEGLIKELKVVLQPKTLKE